MVRIVDFNATQPKSSVDVSTAFDIPQFPAFVQLAKIRLVIPEKCRSTLVELIATVGVQGVTGIAQILFRIFRDGVEIFNTQQGVESAGSEQTYTIAFQAIDKNPEEGSHIYRLTAENIAPNTDAIVVGPISFSGLAIQRKKEGK